MGEFALKPYRSYHLSELRMQLAQPRGSGTYAASGPRARRTMTRLDFCDSGVRDSFSTVIQ